MQGCHCSSCAPGLGELTPSEQAFEDWLAGGRVGPAPLVTHATRPPDVKTRTQMYTALGIGAALLVGMYLMNSSGNRMARDLG